MPHSFSRSARSTAPAGRVRSDASSVIRAAADRSVKPFEELEQRRMLSTSAAATVFNLKDAPVYVASSTDLKDFKTGPLAITGADLGNLYIDYRRAAKNDAALVRNKTEASLYMPDAEHIGVDIGTRTDFDTFAKRMKALGMTITAADSSLGVVEGILPISQVLNIATRSDVALLRPIYRSTANTQGRGNNQGDRVMNTDDLRSTYGLTGAGVTVGVLSDSYNQTSGRDPTPQTTTDHDAQNKYNTSVATRDLPANVNLLNDYDNAFDPASDEGRGMLELIHDVAPSASLAFSTGEGGQLTFADHVRALYAAGASVISDDLTYFQEPFFGPGLIDQAIGEVVAKGAAYTSSAANFSDSGFQQTAQYTTVNNRRFIDFDPSSGVATRMLVKVTTGGDLVLQWDNPYNGVTGNVTSDMDIFFYKPGTNDLVTSSVDFNFATGVPVENVALNPGSYDVEIQLAAVKGSAAPPSVYRVSGPAGVSYTKFATTRNNTSGHNAGPNTIGVAAVAYSDASPYTSAAPVTEDFSSQGPTTQIFDQSGNRLAKKVTLLKPDISGPDAMNTSFFPDFFKNHDYSEGEDTDGDGLPNFSGTSAAAPNVAAGIALIRQVSPRATQAEILSALQSTATPVNGTAKGKWDSFGGYGLVNFQAALPKAVSVFKASISAVTPDPRQDQVDTIKITFNQRVTGFNIDDLTFTRDGGADLLTATNTLTTSDNITYTLRGLTNLTAVDGTYTLTLTSTGSGIKNLLGTALKRDATESFQIYTPGDPPDRPSNFAAETVGATAANLTWKDNSDNEAGFQIIKSTDPSFETYTSIKVGANVTHYLDEDLKPSTKYYYRIRATNPLNGNSGYTAAINSLTAVTGDVVVDNSSKYARVTGFWGTSTTGTGFLGDDYLQDGNSAKGTKSVKYIPPLAGDGKYYVYARWTRSESNATNVPFDIYYGANAALKATVTVDQRNRGGNGWVLVGGPYAMDAGSGASVVIRNTGTNGRVIADSIRFLPSAPLTTQHLLGNAVYGPANPFASGSTVGGDKDKDGSLTDLL